MIVSNKRHISNLNVKINDISLVQCNSYKYLGIHFDDKLNWKTHVQHVCTKVSKACGALAKLRHCVPVDVLIDVYNALIHSYLRYGVIVWGNASDSTLHPLKVLVNKAIRIISFAPLGNVNLAQIYQELNLLPLSNVHSLELGKFTYKEKFGYLPTDIGNYFPSSTNSVVHNYGTRNSSPPSTSQMNKMTYRLRSSEKSVQFKSNALWSSLNDELKSSETVKLFKRRFKKQLIGP